MKVKIWIACVIGILGILGKAWASPTAKVLIVDETNHRVLKVAPNGQVVGEVRNFENPTEVIPLPNGYFLVADRNGIWEVDTGGGKERLKNGSFTYLANIQDIRRTTWWEGPGDTEGSETLLVVSEEPCKVAEITYPEGIEVWSYNMDVFIKEAEKRPGKGTPTYLITLSNKIVEIDKYGNKVEIYSSDYIFLHDAEWTPCNKVLIAAHNTSEDNYQVFIIDKDKDNELIGRINFPSTKRVWEATLIEKKGNVLIAGVNEGGLFKGFVEEHVVIGTFTENPLPIWKFEREESRFLDVEEKGIINFAKIVYADFVGKKIRTTLAGICLPILQVSPPWIVATKTVEPIKDFYKPGDIVTYTITVTNSQEAGTATNVRIIDRIPDGTRYATNTATGGDKIEFCNKGGTTWETNTFDSSVTHIKWIINQLGPGLSRSVSFAVRIKEY